jgi:hypothetical protein
MVTRYRDGSVKIAQGHRHDPRLTLAAILFEVRAVRGDRGGRQHVHGGPRSRQGRQHGLLQLVAKPEAEQVTRA